MKKENAKVLILGNGGREHAIAYKIAKSPHVEKVFVAPGNGGTATEEKCENVAIDITDPVKVAQFAWSKRITLTIVGPEKPLEDKVVDVFEHSKMRIVGPRSSAALLETSKTFAKKILTDAKVPTAPYLSTESVREAHRYIKNRYKDGAPIVIKADGLAAGKGVHIERTIYDACDKAHQILVGKIHGAAGDRIIIEDFVHGEEVSLIAFVSNADILPLHLSKDYKKIGDGNEGVNTGGMGAYSPVFLMENNRDYLVKTVLVPVVTRMLERKTPFKGFLYAGLCVDVHGIPYVLEFNVRSGDPETEPLMMRLDSDLYELCSAIADNELEGKIAKWSNKYAVGVIVASGGYPGEYTTNYPIFGLRISDELQNAKVFHCGTKKIETTGTIATSGGRVLCVCGLGDTMANARHTVYGRVGRIKFTDMYYRKDIAGEASLEMLAG